MQDIGEMAEAVPKRGTMLFLRKDILILPVEWVILNIKQVNNAWHHVVREYHSGQTVKSPCCFWRENGLNQPPSPVNMSHNSRQIPLMISVGIGIEEYLDWSLSSVYISNLWNISKEEALQAEYISELKLTVSHKGLHVNRMKQKAR